MWEIKSVKNYKYSLLFLSRYYCLSSILILSLPFSFSHSFVYSQKHIISLHNNIILYGFSPEKWNHLHCINYCLIRNISSDISAVERSKHFFFLPPIHVIYSAFLFVSFSSFHSFSLCFSYSSLPPIFLFSTSSYSLHSCFRSPSSSFRSTDLLTSKTKLQYRELNR